MEDLAHRAGGRGVGTLTSRGHGPRKVDDAALAFQNADQRTALPIGSGKPRSHTSKATSRCHGAGAEKTKLLIWRYLACIVL